MTDDRLTRRVGRRFLRRVGFSLLAGAAAIAWMAGAAPSAESARAQSSQPRRVNIPYLATTVDWAQSAIFWFGVNDSHTLMPGRNYADVRLAYTASALQVRVVVADYYLWYVANATAASDLSQYDAVAIYLDTNHDRASAPQTDDYLFLSGARDANSLSQYRRQARGNGTGWNTAWNGTWSDYSVMQWNCNPGPNSNTCGIDYGWTSIFTVTWQSLGLSGPPPEGSVWGVAVQLHDRDDSAQSGMLAPEFWPETFNANQPGSWGELRFGYAGYPAPPAAASGALLIRAASPADNTVEDAWLGGGGACSGGHEGGSEVNHGDAAELFVGAEVAPTHFPCFNKSYLRFNLGAIPPNKMIISASLTLHVWGNAGDPGQAQPSRVHLFSITDDWQEMSIHWNNAPLARENVSAIWMYPYSRPGNIQWPGDPYTWDATQAVAEAYAEGRPVSLAIYGSDTAQHSSKYLTASETGNWNVAGRPALRVTWGEPATTVRKSVAPVAPGAGDTVTYTLTFLGNGQALALTDTLPAQVGAPGPIQRTTGSANYNGGTHQVIWNGSPAAGQPVTITFPTAVNHGVGRMAVSNMVVLSDAQGRSSSATAILIVDAYQAWLPAMLKQP